MILLVTEKCMHDTSGNRFSGTRTYKYEVEGAKSLEEAFESYANHYDSDNIFDCNDSFAGGCLSSYTQSVSIYEK